MKRINPLPSWLTSAFILPLIALNGWVAFQLFLYFQSLIAVLITAMLLAFILDYPVSAFQRLHVPRGRAVLLVLLMALMIAILVGVTLIPLVIEQINELGTQFPVWMESSNQQLQAVEGWARARQLPVDFGKLLNHLEEQLSAQLQSLSGKVVDLLVGIATSVFNLLLTIVMTFYILLYGEPLWAGVYRWLPSKTSRQIQLALRQNFHNYYVGQSALATLMGTAMTTAFLLMQIPFGLLFGLVIGFMTLFPFGAGFGICIVSLLTALQNIWLGLKVLVVATLIDQLVESGLAPQLIGGFTGLNPVWILISLLIGAKVGGLLGILVAVPLAGSIKSILDSMRDPSADVESP